MVGTECPSSTECIQYTGQTATKSEGSTEEEKQQSNVTSLPFSPSNVEPTKQWLYSRLLRYSCLRQWIF